jgi:hypothetical protein
MAIQMLVHLMWGSPGMRITKAAMTAMLCISMAGTPVLAQSAAPLSVAHSVSRAEAGTDDVNELNGGYILPAIIILAVIAGAILLASGGNNNPSSP